MTKAGDWPHSSFGLRDSSLIRHSGFVIRHSLAPYDPFVRPINPATEEPLEEVPDHAPADIEAKLRGAADAFASWRRKPMSERSRLMRRAASVLRDRSADLSALMTREMGKPVVAAEAE